MQGLGSHNPADVVLVGGEALYDLVPAGDAGDLSAHAGGGPFNTARTIGRLGQPVAFLGRLSTDSFGAGHERMLAADGVRLGAVVRTDQPTMLALAEMDPDGVASYRFYAQGTAAPGLRVQEALATLPPAVSAVHVGTLGLALEPVATALEAVVARLAGTALVALDPNCRPDAVADERAYRARLERIAGRAHLVKASEEDLRWLVPDRQPLDAARDLLRQGPSVVIVTRGPGGAAVVAADREIEVAAPRIEVADTIGAGDAFGGAFLAWWRSHGLGRDALADTARVVDATRFAIAVAARTCERPGASPPWASELE